MAGPKPGTTRASRHFILNALIRSHELSDLLNVEVDAANLGQVTTAIWQLFAQQAKEFEKLPHLKKLAERFDFPMIYLLAKYLIPRHFATTSKAAQRDERRVCGKITELEQKIYGHAGRSLTSVPPAQLGMILFESSACQQQA